MLKNENMYKTVYFLDLQRNAVSSGRLTQTLINEAGYIIHLIKSGKRLYKSVDDALVFYTREEAEKALPTYKPINDEMIKLARDMNKRLDDMREQINGKPHFPEYVEELIKEGR